MTTSADIVRTAEGQLGYVEKPVNRNKYGAAYGMDRQPWCGFFVAWVFLQCGIDLRKFCDNVGYTPNLFGDLKAIGLAVAKTTIRAGDIVFFKFANRINHVGIGTGHGSTIDGNTGTGGTREYNGGGVARKNRGTGQVAGVIRWKFAADVVAQATNTLQALRYAIDLAKLHVLGTGYANPPEAVKILQVGLNRWADQFAAMVGAPNPPDLAVNGIWDPPTEAAVLALQRMMRIPDHGNRLLAELEAGGVGPLTWRILYP